MRTHFYYWYFAFKVFKSHFFKNFEKKENSFYHSTAHIFVVIKDFMKILVKFDKKQHRFQNDGFMLPVSVAIIHFSTITHEEIGVIYLVNVTFLHKLENGNTYNSTNCYLAERKLRDYPLILPGAIFFDSCSRTEDLPQKPYVCASLI